MNLLIGLFTLNGIEGIGKPGLTELCEGRGLAAALRANKDKNVIVFAPRLHDSRDCADQGLAGDCPRVLCIFGAEIINEDRVCAGDSVPFKAQEILANGVPHTTLHREKYGVTDLHGVYDFILDLEEIAKAGVVGVGPSRCHSIGELAPRKISANRHSLLEGIVEVFTAKTCIVLHNELHVVDRVIELPIFVACELAYPVIVFVRVVKTVLETLEVGLSKLFTNLRNLHSLVLQLHKRRHFVRRRTRACVVVQIAVEMNTDEIEGVAELSARGVRAMMGIRENAVVIENQAA